jgi:hypothetical protein
LRAQDLRDVRDRTALALVTGADTWYGDKFAFKAPKTLNKLLRHNEVGEGEEVLLLKGCELGGGVIILSGHLSQTSRRYSQAAEGS